VPSNIECVNLPAVVVSHLLKVLRAPAVRNWISAASVAFLLVPLGSSELVHAHGGDLNAQGCHNNRKTGSYHCHRSSSSPATLPPPSDPSWPVGRSIPDRIQARVLSIGDGDTIRVSAVGQNITVRLACIDAPELAQSPHGVQARDQLRVLIPAGSSVLLSVQARDRYGRAVAEIFKGTQNVNHSLVSSGAAFVYWKYIAKCDRSSYASAESLARFNGRGVWSQPGGAMRPWVYR